MTYSLFSTAGCMRCRIVKTYLRNNGIDYREFDFKGEGKDAFNIFYRKNRSHIHRGEEGVEFPLLYDGERVLQGVGVIVAFFENPDLLRAMVTRSDLSHGWVSGLTIVPEDISIDEVFIHVVSFLKHQGLFTQIDTDGHHANMLTRLIDDALIDRLRFTVWGPPDLYERVSGTPLEEQVLAQSLSVMDRCPEYQLILPVTPFVRNGETTDLITPEEAGQAAAFIEQATSRKTHPFVIEDRIPPNEKERFGALNLFKYRTACRRYMVKADIST